MVGRYIGAFAAIVIGIILVLSNYGLLPEHYPQVGFRAVTKRP